MNTNLTLTYEDNLTLRAVLVGKIRDLYVTIGNIDARAEDSISSEEMVKELREKYVGETEKLNDLLDRLRKSARTAIAVKNEGGEKE